MGLWDWIFGIKFGTKNFQRLDHFVLPSQERPMLLGTHRYHNELSLFRVEKEGAVQLGLLVSHKNSELLGMEWSQSSGVVATKDLEPLNRLLGGGAKGPWEKATFGSLKHGLFFGRGPSLAIADWEYRKTGEVSLARFSNANCLRVFELKKKGTRSKRDWTVLQFAWTPGPGPAGTYVLEVPALSDGSFSLQGGPMLLLDGAATSRLREILRDLSGQTWVA